MDKFSSNPLLNVDLDYFKDVLRDLEIEEVERRNGTRPDQVVPPFSSHLK